jgi:hypothetical protein
VTFSDATTAATYERRQFLCLPLDNGRVLWVAVTFGRLFAWNGRTWVPYVATAEQATDVRWKVSVRGPTTVRRKSRGAG